MTVILSILIGIRYFAYELT